MEKFDLENDEKVINSWTLLYTPPSGGKYNGKLIVTNKRLLYDAKFDVSAHGIVDEMLWHKKGSEAYISIPKDKIKSLSAEKSFFAKKAVLTLEDGKKHTFNYGMLNIDPVIKAIEEK
jgi:hypothetical protein